MNASQYMRTKKKEELNKFHHGAAQSALFGLFQSGRMRTGKCSMHAWEK